jgi:hypothetical protein
MDVETTLDYVIAPALFKEWLLRGLPHLGARHGETAGFEKPAMHHEPPARV